MSVKFPLSVLYIGRGILQVKGSVKTVNKEKSSKTKNGSYVVEIILKFSQTWGKILK